MSISAIGGDCWQGELCKQRCLTNANLTRWVASINYVPMCCPFCERSGFYLSNKECRCLHNGPDPQYQPTEEELREVEEFNRVFHILDFFFDQADYYTNCSLA